MKCQICGHETGKLGTHITRKDGNQKKEYESIQVFIIWITCWGIDMSNIKDYIFYIYTNHQLDINFDEWLDKIGYSENYDVAKAKQEYIWRELHNE